MMNTKQFKSWAASLDDDQSVAVDEGGLCIVELIKDNKETGRYCEIGGIPSEEKISHV